MINKIGFGVTAYLAVKGLSGDDQESLDRLPQGVDGLSALRVNVETGRPERRTR